MDGTSTGWIMVSIGVSSLLQVLAHVHPQEVRVVRGTRILGVNFYRVRSSVGLPGLLVNIPRSSDNSRGLEVMSEVIWITSVNIQFVLLLRLLSIGAIVARDGSKHLTSERLLLVRRILRPSVVERPALLFELVDWANQNLILVLSIGYVLDFLTSDASEVTVMPRSLVVVQILASRQRGAIASSVVKSILDSAHLPIIKIRLKSELRSQCGQLNSNNQKLNYLRFILELFYFPLTTGGQE